MAEPAPHPLVAGIMADAQQDLTRLCRSDIRNVAELSDYALLGGGKRLRPLMLSLVGMGMGASRASLRPLATAVEALHCATLVHDDLIDASDLRHGKPSISSRWGVAGAVLTGDLLYARCFEIIASVERPELRTGLAEVARELSEGELLQMQHEHDLDCPIDNHMRILDSKTASLFRYCAMAGVWQAGGSPAQLRLADGFGSAFGRAYQLIDDILDYRPEHAHAGKHSREDLRRGRITLPLLLFCRDPERRRQAAGWLAQLRGGDGDAAVMGAIAAAVESSGALDEARAVARQHLGGAGQALERLLPAGDIRELLRGMVATAGGRLGEGSGPQFRPAPPL